MKDTKVPAAATATIAQPIHPKSDRIVAALVVPGSSLRACQGQADDDLQRVSEGEGGIRRWLRTCSVPGGSASRCCGHWLFQSDPRGLMVCPERVIGLPRAAEFLSVGQGQ